MIKPPAELINAAIESDDTLKKLEQEIVDYKTSERARIQQVQVDLSREYKVLSALYTERKGVQSRINWQRRRLKVMERSKRIPKGPINDTLRRIGSRKRTVARNLSIGTTAP
jgi:hypothetical protein